MFTKKTSLIIPTRNRPDKLENLLKDLKKFNITFKKIIIVDSSDEKFKKKIISIASFFFATLIFTKPSTSHQRNMGLKNIHKSSEFIMFTDDDILFYKDAFLKMNETIIQNKKNKKICGYGFNLIDTKHRTDNFFDLIKKNRLLETLNLYSRLPGQITRSGWQTKILNLKEDLLSDWIYTAASIYKRDFVKNIKFEKSFGNYSYLEDLDFSLSITNSKYKILVCHKSKFQHKNFIERVSFLFGYYEIINRFFIVKKNNFNFLSFFTVACMRLFISFIKIFLRNPFFIFRFLGNIFGLAIVIINTIFLLNINFFKKKK